MPTSLWICDPRGRCLAVNDSYLAFRGTELDEELGDGWATGVHPDDIENCMSTWERQLQAQQPYQLRYRIQAADGTYRMILEEASPWYREDGTFGGLAGSISDITDHTAGRETLDAADLYRTTLDALHEGVVVTDSTGRILAMNDAAATMLDSDRNGRQHVAQVTGALELIDESGRHIPRAERPIYLAMSTGERIIGRVVGNVGADGAIRWFNVNSMPLHRIGTDEVFATVTSFLDITSVKAAADDAQHQARHDALTGLVNRWGLRERVVEVLDRAKALDLDVAVAYCDMDRFKEINDRYGHAVGDELLQAVARRIRDHVRASDVVARIGGDEILMVLADTGGLDGALDIACRLLERISEPIRLEGVELIPRVSIGVAMVTSMDSFDEALRRADDAMYEAKFMGRNRVVTLDV